MSHTKPTARKVAKKKAKKTVTEEPKVVESKEQEEEEPKKKIEQRLDETIVELKDFKAMVRGMCNEWIDRMMDAKREIRELRRTQKKPRPKNVREPKKPHQFEIPVPISEQLCNFLGKPKGTLMSRNQVTHAIHKYCDRNGLMQDTNRRNIDPDKKMKVILKGLPSGTQLTWLNLQSYIKHHY